MATTQAIGTITETISNLDADSDQLIKFESKIPLGSKISVFIENVKHGATAPTIQLAFAQDKTSATVDTDYAKVGSAVNVSGASGDTVTDVLKQDKADGLFVAVDYVENDGDATVKFNAILLAEKPIS